jgi:peptide-methionine (R)-S-oxide reductase
MKYTAYSIVLILVLVSCNQKSSLKNKNMMTLNKNEVIADTNDLPKTDAEWKAILPTDVYEISRNKGTERPFTGKYNDHKELGTYVCVACKNPLFKSNGKFESSCGWPSFFEPINKGSIIYTPDNSHGMKRTEVMCGKCKGHLGHVFEDGPPPTGLRYCINSVILDFEGVK